MVAKTVLKSGDKFGFLTYIEDSNPDITFKDKKVFQHRRKIICSCVCGKIRDYSYERVSNGQVKSCGCYRKLAYRKPQSTEHFDYGFLKSKERDAIKRGIEYSITCENLENQYILQEGKCFYTGQKLPERGTEKGCEISIDRFDNSLGYTIENIRLCLPMYNIMKYTHTYEEFVQMCRSVTQHYDANHLQK